jgi:hypothetical protein
MWGNPPAVLLLCISADGGEDGARPVTGVYCVAGGRGTARGQEDTLPHKKFNGDSRGTCGGADQLREETRVNLLAFVPPAAWPLESARRPSTTACVPTLNGGGVVRPRDRSRDAAAGVRLYGFLGARPATHLGLVRVVG